MKFRLLAASMLLAACATPAQIEHLDVCPNPVNESMAWAYVSGVATDVVDARTFRLRTDDGRTVTVTIPNVGATSAAGAVDALRRLVQGKKVEVFVNPKSREDLEVIGEVHVGKTDVGHELLRTGMAPFEPAPAYTISGYSECVNEIASREAQQQGLGMWSKA
jgi:endonuclease YncB( thermonuclease family)